MAVRDVTGDVKCHGKTCREQAHDQETGKAYMIKIFRVEKQIWDAEVLAKIAGDHGEQNDPANHQYYIPPDVVEKKLNRKRIGNLREQEVKFSHKRNSISSY